MSEQINEAAWQLAHHINTAPERPTLRDQFAMAALTGLLAKAWGDYALQQDADHIATQAGAIADAMMKERGS